MMLVVAMFDDADRLDAAYARVDEAGFEDRAQRYDGLPQSATPGSAGLSEGGDQPYDMARSFEVSSPTPDATRASEEPTVLPGRELNDEERSYYARLLNEGGRVLAVRADGEDAERVARLLEESGASRVVRHH